MRAALFCCMLALALACTRQPDATPAAAPPRAPEPAFELHLYGQPGTELRVFEVRPRTREIPAWRVAVPATDRDAVAEFSTGAPGSPPHTSADAGRIEATITDPRFGELWMVGADTPIGPGRSAYLGLTRRPRAMYVGARGEPFVPIDPGRLAAP